MKNKQTEKPSVSSQWFYGYSAFCQIKLPFDMYNESQSFFCIFFCVSVQFARQKFSKLHSVWIPAIFMRITNKCIVTHYNNNNIEIYQFSNRRLHFFVLVLETNNKKILRLHVTWILTRTNSTNKYKFCY